MRENIIARTLVSIMIMNDIPDNANGIAFFDGRGTGQTDRESPWGFGANLYSISHVCSSWDNFKGSDLVNSAKDFKVSDHSSLTSRTQETLTHGLFPSVSPWTRLWTVLERFPCFTRPKLVHYLSLGQWMLYEQRRRHTSGKLSSFHPANVTRLLLSLAILRLEP